MCEIQTGGKLIIEFDDENIITQSTLMLIMQGHTHFLHHMHTMRLAKAAK